MPIWFGLQWKSNLSMPVCFPLTLSFPVLSFPLCLILVLWVVIYVFFFCALLLVYVACFTSWWWQDVLTRQECRGGWLQLCLFVLERTCGFLPQRQADTFTVCTSCVAKAGRKFPLKVGCSCLEVLQQQLAGWKKALGLLISRPCQYITLLASTNCSISKENFMIHYCFLPSFISHFHWQCSLMQCA